MVYPISFPNLNLTFNINPVAISIFGINIYWYGIIIVSSILIGLFLAKKFDGTYGIKYDDIFDFALIALFLGIICARAYYVIFKLDYYKMHPKEIFMIWNGGLAIYGGIIGGVIAAIFFCKKRKISFLNLADYIIPYLSLGQAMGRWGNFINQEAYGSLTESFLKMQIFDKNIGKYINVHPTFLYESIIDIALFAILMYLRKKRKFKGQLLYTYLIVYGAGRAIVEGLRTDSLMIGNFRVSQILSVILMTFGLIAYILAKNVDEKSSK